jgi:hypothetical protein
MQTLEPGTERRSVPEHADYRPLAPTSVESACQLPKRVISGAPTTVLAIWSRLRSEVVPIP